MRLKDQLVTANGNFKPRKKQRHGEKTNCKIVGW